MKEIKEEDAYEKDWLLEVVREYWDKPDWVRTKKGFDKKEEAMKYLKKVNLRESKKYGKPWTEHVRVGKLKGNKGAVKCWHADKVAGEDYWRE